MLPVYDRTALEAVLFDAIQASLLAYDALERVTPQYEDRNLHDAALFAAGITYDLVRQARDLMDAALAVDGKAI